MHKYAQIDNNKIVVGISDLSGEIDHKDMILLSEDEEVNFEDIYDYITKEFTSPPKTFDDIKRINITDNDIINANNLLNMVSKIILPQNKNLVKKYYDMKIYDKNALDILVQNGVITKEDIKEITKKGVKNGE